MGKVLKAHIAKNKIDKAKELDEFEINLIGYTQIEDEAAKLLSECDLAIDLRNLENLSEESAKHLSAHKGSIDLAALYGVSPKVASFLALKDSFIHFEMPSITEEIAGIFSKGVARLKMTGLKKLNSSNEHIALLHYLSSTGQLTRLPYAESF